MGSRASRASTSGAFTSEKPSLSRRSLEKLQLALPGVHETVWLPPPLPLVKRAPPRQRKLTWLPVVEAKLGPCESAQTKEPSWSAWAKYPAARLCSPCARLDSPPGTAA